MIDNWRKSSASADNSSCVETGWAGNVVGYRDTKQATLSGDDRPTLMFSRSAAGAFLTMITAR
ncbi:DUF397 domain-containing protein [Actinophytocola sediminis]